MSATQYDLLQMSVDDKTCWTVPVLDSRSRPVPWAAFGDYSAPVLAHFADDDTGFYTVSSLSDTGLYSISEAVDDDFTGSSCYSRRSLPVDEVGHTEDLEALDEEEESVDEPREVGHSFVFRGAQHETVRTIIRASSEPAPSGLDTYETDSEASWTSGDLDDFSDPGTETPLLCRSPPPDPLSAVRCGIERIAARQHLEEDLDFREHEWLLQQIGCGRMEIWVTEERIERTEQSEDTRPRVFFAPPSSSGRRQSLDGMA